MKGRGLVYRSTTALGLGVFAFHFLGGGLLGKYKKKAPGFDDNDTELLNPEYLQKSIDDRKKLWKERQTETLDKISDKSTMPILEDIERKDGIKDIRLRKTVEKDPEIEKKKNDGYI
ncbi:unnamed protein product [Moneuplotes crassus]|uniref:Uncharacterized protein n=2 Tax=Euplotes crassus TaxID=5936 RepID=A0AAD2D7D3_EUPCR|nr:unnamed protein product [Moneuplotes crassus]CAI2383974.1 unnamed protein product [Moneuplotes crassus]